jgi:hypothetical protein
MWVRWFASYGTTSAMKDSNPVIRNAKQSQAAATI